ncbi:MAG: KH domain-containing protein [Elusimicrobia bacterium]|nr:MAG: KH domain-containing protein [Elusimicrobiota bacterium]KAF0154080.1 MAG: KH domain-containing protein [Elusimicrobiota bacterium]
MKELVTYMVNALVDDNQGVKLSMSEDGGVVRFRLSVSASDRGKVIGREGRTIKAMRSLLQASAEKEGKKVFLDIV